MSFCTRITRSPCTYTFAWLCREFEEQSFKFQCHGAIFNKNKIEDFKTCDKMALICEEGRLIWDDIVSGRCLHTPSLFTRFIVLSFAVSASIPLKINGVYYTFFFCFLHRIWNHSIIIIGSPIHVQVSRSSIKRTNTKQSLLNLPQHNCNNWMTFTSNWPTKAEHFSFWDEPMRNSNTLSWPTKSMPVEKTTISAETIRLSSISASRIQVQATKMLVGRWDCFCWLSLTYGNQN